MLQLKFDENDTANTGSEMLVYIWWLFSSSVFLESKKTLNCAQKALKVYHFQTIMDEDCDGIEYKDVMAAILTLLK